MTIDQAISQVDALTFNQIDAPAKRAWLERLDALIRTEVHGAHIGCASEPDGEDALLVPAPYDELYRWYLEMHIHDANGELVKYNNAAAKYNAALLAYMDYVNRTYPSKGVTALTLV